jgi:hypothetical protein
MFERMRVFAASDAAAACGGLLNIYTTLPSSGNT